METVAKEDQEDPAAQAAPEPLEVEAEPEVTEVKLEEPELSWFDSATVGDLRNLSLHATGFGFDVGVTDFLFFWCKVLLLEVRTAGLQFLILNCRNNLDSGG